MMNRSTSRLLACSMTLGVGTMKLLSACSSNAPTGPAEQVGVAHQHLDPAQCLYFDVNGTARICHATGSLSHPYTVVKTSDQACINGHAGHAHDYIAVGDPTCQGGGCLPQGAPCDATLPCCSGSTCTDGTCVQSCVPTTCAAQGALCGTVSDGCGDTLACNACTDGGGSCASDNTCSCPLPSGYDADCATNAWDEAAQTCELTFASAGTVCQWWANGHCDDSGHCFFPTVPPTVAP